MNHMNRNRLWLRGVLALVLAVLGATLSLASTRPIGQEAEEKPKEVKRVRIGRSPCFVLHSARPRGTLGVELMDLTPELRNHFGTPADVGVMVSKVLKDSPASKAGLQVGDIITRMDGEEVSSAREISRLVRGKKQGDVMDIDVQRERAPRSITVNIEERERSEVDLGAFVSEDCDELDMNFDFAIDEDSIRDAVESATESFRNPEWRAKWRHLESLREEELEQKLKELEKRLKELEKELEKKWSKDQEPS